MSERYFIREVNCEYNDEYMYHLSPGRIISKFMDKDTAIEKINVLERQKYREQFEYIGDYISNYSSEYWEKANALTNFMRDNFGINLGNDIRYGKKPEREPTPQELNELRNIVGFEFYELNEFEGQVLFYVPILNPKIIPNSEQKMNMLIENQIITFYPSYSKALENMCYFYYQYYTDHPVILGTIDELSDTPDVLKSIIKGNDKITHENNQLKIHRYDEKLLLLINGLLKEKPILVQEKTMEEIE